MSAPMPNSSSDAPSIACCGCSRTAIWSKTREILVMARQLLSSPKGTDVQGNALAVLEFQSPPAALIATPIPRSARYVSSTVGVAVLACIVAASVVKTDKIVSAQGKLVSTVPTQMLQPLQTSIVRNIFVHPGQIVHKGQLLAELDPTFAAADSQADQAQVYSYSAQVA